jgi:hypothetical protein
MLYYTKKKKKEKERAEESFRDIIVSPLLFKKIFCETLSYFTVKLFL